MTVKELIQKLSTYDENMEVFIEKTSDEFEYTIVNDVTVKNVLFSEGDGNPETEAYDDVVIISDF